MAGYDGRGYLLPPGEAFTEETQCCFVFLPAGDEYRRAFFGSLDYFATWLAWERDDEKRGKDAARAWKLANELTRECWEMGACELMLDKLDQLIALQSTSTCCAGNEYTTYNDNRIETTTIVPGEGDSPTHYGETPVADWDEWAEYVCYHAHELVDDLINAANKIDSLLDLGIWAIDAFFWLVRKIVFRDDGWPIPIDLAWAGNIFKGILQGGEGLFNIVADDIESARDDIVCALMNGTSVEDAVESALSATVAWTLFYQFVDYETLTAVIYNGGIDDMGYLTPSKRSDCTCDPVNPDGEYCPNFHWKVSSSKWTLGGQVDWLDVAYSEDGFNIDGVFSVLDKEYPTSYSHCRSEDFSWPGGRADFRSLARSAVSGTPSIQNTYIVLRLHRASDNQIMDSYGFTHGGGSGLWSLQLDQDTSSYPADDYYLTIAWDGSDGYDRYLDYVSMRPYNT